MITERIRPATKVRRGTLLTPATWVVLIRSPGISRPMKTASAPRRRNRCVARSNPGRNPSVSAAFISAGRPTAAKTSRPMVAPTTVAVRSAATIGIGSTVSLAIAIPAMIRSRSPGAKGTGIPVSSMKTSPAMTPIKRSPLRLAIEPIGFIRRPQRRRRGAERLLLWAPAASPVGVRAHEGVGLFRRIPFLYRVLDARPKLFLHPVAGDQHLDPGEPEISLLEIGARIAALQGANGIKAEVRQKPRAGYEDLGLPARVVWHGATINGSQR